MKKKWWMTTNIYQIYLRSFYDSNNDGIGDLKGVIEKLEYLKALGIETIWISPHYDSPMDDNGYDVRDFLKVSEDYGDIPTFKALIEKTRELDMKVLIDLVLNHTSDEHEWFKIACDKNHPLYEKYHDYFIWHPGKVTSDGKKELPTRWVSWFGGPTWDYIESVDEYYLHIFSKKMPDLNWRNEDMKNDLKKIIKFWIDLGVDGFRVDAANHLEKNWEFPDGVPGYENFSSLPKHHEYIKELALELFEPYNLLTLGESGGASKEEVRKYVGFNSHEFNLLIHFGHCWADTGYTNDRILGKWSKSQLRVNDIKRSYAHQYEVVGDQGFNLIYWHNHDQPRVVSHYGNVKEYHLESAKMLAITLYFMPGVAIVYQGEEIGMTNVLYENIEDFRDVEVFTEFQNMLNNGASRAEALQAIVDRSRDNARTPMQWDESLNGGFSKVTPWINTNYNYKEINVAKQEKDEDSILNTYRYILNLRRSDSENIIFGEIEFFNIDDNESYCYINRGNTCDYLVVANFRDYEINVSLKDIDFNGFKYFYGSEANLKDKMKLSPYQATVYKRKKA
ncbi:MAG: alpha-glucosidase [Candidatus Izemoplasmatales bacterium]|jgi:glycosidase|nr:alpha-glucosidase [Candidatus Izemoplasmatales bacterium]